MTIPADDRSQKLTPNIIGEWVLEEASDPKFPFRVRIYTRKRAEPVLSLFVQDRWPGSNQHIFCLRENRMAEDVVVDGELELARAKGPRFLVAAALEAIGVQAIRDTQTQDAVRMLAAADALRQDMGVPV